MDNGSSILEYSLQGSLTSSFPLPRNFARYASGVSAPVVLPSGEIVVSSYYGKAVDGFSPAGAILFSVDPDGGNPTGIFDVDPRGRLWIAVSLRQERRSILINGDGSRVGAFPLVDDSGFVTLEHNGDLLYAAAGYVTEWNRTAMQVVTRFGSPSLHGMARHTGGPYAFYYQGQAVAGPGGRIYTSDPNNTIEESSRRGVLEAATTLNGALSLAGSNAYLVGRELFLQTGTPFSSNDQVSVIGLSQLESYLAAPRNPLDTLGWGAGLWTGVRGNYFGSNAKPRVYAEFSSPWSSARHLELSYAVEDSGQISSGDAPKPRQLVLPRSRRALAHVVLPLDKEDFAPGPYQVRASLYEGSPRVLIGSTCLPYAVGAKGDRLDLASLPKGAGAGGPSDLRGVVLNSELGLNGLRGGLIDWRDFLPGCNAAAPTASTCGPKAFRPSAAPLSYFRAAYAAKRHRVTYWVQVTGGDPISQALIKNGWWHGDVAALSRFYSRPPRGCKRCAAVTAWEPWNEPNNSGFPNPALYVSQVLRPFYAGVKESEPKATVIGGSTLGVSLGWWRGLIAAGGLRDMNVASIHPYPPNNESWEEAGVVAQIRQLEQLLRSMHLWITEVGWWSNGNFNLVEQSNIIARALLWMKILRIPVWSYYFDEGSWGNDGVSFSLVQTAPQGDDYVKPAALASMTSAHILNGRNFLGRRSTGTPDVYAARFSGVRGRAMAAVWSDDLRVETAVSFSGSKRTKERVTIESEYGASRTVRVTPGWTYRLAVSGRVEYLIYPSHSSIHIRPPEPYGNNIGLAVSGATASASSGDASLAISGDPSSVGWRSAPGDEHPEFTLRLSRPHLVNRIIIDTQSVGSTATGLRDFTVSIEQRHGTWTRIGSIHNEFTDHEVEVSFKARLVTLVRIDIGAINYGGYLGGAIPPFWSDGVAGTACIHSIGVYEGRDGEAALALRRQPALPAP